MPVVQLIFLKQYRPDNKEVNTDQFVQERYCTGFLPTGTMTVLSKLTVMLPEMFLVVLLASELVDKKPKAKKQKLFSVRASVQINKHGKDNIFLKDNLCFAQDRDFTNHDLNHFCKGTKQWTSN